MRPCLVLLVFTWIVVGHVASLSITSVAAQTATCAVTQANPAAQPPASIDPTVRPVGLNWSWYGNRYVWTQLPPESTFQLTRVDGRLSMKFPWWRLRAGKLSITGHPVGASAPHVSARIPDGYGSTGFQSTGLTFPTYGCWRVTGRVRGKGVSVVLRVIPGSQNGSPLFNRG
jgi:hypothetical protein